MMLSHSELASTPFILMTLPDIPDMSSMLSKPSVVPELVQVVAKAPSTYTSTVLVRSSPLYNADTMGQGDSDGVEDGG